jgi:hypothetical protein
MLGRRGGGGSGKERDEGEGGEAWKARGAHPIEPKLIT